MRYAHDGMTLWTGTQDAPSPGEAVSAGEAVPITIGVQPINASNQVEVRYGVNQELPKTVSASWIRNNPSRKAQYFRAELPAFKESDTVECTVICRCAGRQIPLPADAREVATSFHVTAPAPKQAEFFGQKTLAKGVSPKPAASKTQAIEQSATSRVDKRAVGRGDVERVAHLTSNTVVVDTEGPRKVLGSPNERSGVGGDGALNPKADSRKLKSTSELLELTTQLKKHLGKAAFKDLQEDKERHDITDAANKSGWDARLVAMLKLADEQSSESGIPSDFYYALFRAGIPNDKDGLYQINAEAAADIWRKAIDENIIPENLKGRIDQDKQVFKKIRHDHVLKEAQPIGISPIRDLLPATLGSDKQKQFVEMYYDHQGDIENFWTKAESAFGNANTDKLRLNGKLGYLTVNNAQLIGKLQQEKHVKDNPIDLIANGFYKAEKWETLMATGIPVPKEFPGDNDNEKKKNYAAYMAHQLKTSYQTAVVAELVGNDQLPVKGDNSTKTAVIDFLKNNQGKFEIGSHPVNQFLDDNKIDLGNDAKEEVKRIQRLYQVSSGDEAMIGLAVKGFDSAYTITQYEEQDFIDNFKQDLGGEEAARLTYAKANQIHSTVLSATTTYLTYHANPRIYALSGIQNPNENAEDIIAYPILEELFDEMDFCSCEHCRSVLSPAAYLVDLLQFIDLNKTDSKGQPLPNTYEKENPLKVLCVRRPDIEHIQLTCENTNTVLPYIDLVNEILEYYVINDHSIADFAGHNIEEGVTTEELLANPQFVCETAYTILKDEVYPFNLPFNRPLAALRVYFDHLKVPLHEAMETVRVNDDLDVVTTNANPPSFAWRDIHLEFLGISREEYLIFTDSGVRKLPAYFRRPENVPFTLFDGTMANAKTLAKTVGVTYKELVEIIKTQFINTNSHLILKLEKLRVSLGQIKAFNDGDISDAEFDALLPAEIDSTLFGGNIKQWVKDGFDSIATLILLTPTGDNPLDECDFGSLELKYALPINGENRLRPIEYWKLFRFIRLWKKLGWSIEETDKAITALYKPEFALVVDDVTNAALKKLDDGFKDLLVKLAHAERIRKLLKLNKKGSLIKLLALWSDIDTKGSRSLYRQMFLSLSLSKLNKKFQEDGFGNYLTDDNEKLVNHQLTLQTAFNLTDEDFTQVFTDIGLDHDTALSLENISHVYRYSVLARSLRISMGEFIALKQLSGIEPFSELEPVNPNILVFIQLVKRIKESEFKVQDLNYLLQHLDETGNAQPKPDDMLALAITLRGTLGDIEQEYAIEDDPTGEIAQTKMALIYGVDVAGKFFGILNGTSSYSVDYSHTQPELGSAITDVNANLEYDDLAKNLLYQGIMTEEEKNALVNIAGVSNDFKDAVQALFDGAADDFRQFFQQYPDLKSLYENFVASEQSIDTVLEDFLPAFKEQAKVFAVKQTMASLTGADQRLVNSFLEKPLADGVNYVLHAEGEEEKPSIHDFIHVGEPGVSAEYFFANTITANADIDEAIISNISFTRDLNNRLPDNPTGTAISARWRFYLTVSANQNYNFYVETDPGAFVKLAVDGIERTVVEADGDGNWRNQKAISLGVGKLYLVELTITKVKNKARLKWESHGIAKGLIPDKHLYPFHHLQNFFASYTRLLKSLLLVEKLCLGVKGVQFVSNFDELKFDNSEGEPKTGLFNRLPVTVKPNIATVRALFGRLTRLLKLVDLKESLGSSNGEFFDVLKNPSAKNAEGETLLLKITGWTEKTKQILLQHFHFTENDLSNWENFLRLQRAYVMLDQLGVPAGEYLQWLNNDPEIDTVQQVQNSLRAKYEQTAWLNALQPINDKLRTLQRNALLSYVLHQIQQTDATINTADKLFEYFLIDVEMDPCMKTSRIKQAISTVQLFIQRCLMNLELDVASSSIKAKQWEWMKRYRVWEANRKIFLYPENWLEPELRDNKSPIFKDFESELLQSDINEESAHTALGHYLEKLDEVAKLEISGMYLQENDVVNKEDDILHVFGRTPGMNRKYFYRRFEYGYWTPWEKVDLDIEDNPILPVIWNNRLFLFWLNIIVKGAPPKLSSSAGNKNLTELTTDDLGKLPGDAKVIVEVNLSWSEYYNNKWQPRMTSDYDAPLKIGTWLPNEFKRNEIKLFSRFDDANGEFGMQLVIPIASGLGVRPGYFKLFNKHSVPVSDNGYYEAPEIKDHYRAINSAISTADNKLNIKYLKRVDGKLVNLLYHEILNQPYIPIIIEPNNKVNTLFESPIFYQDARHVFSILTSEKQKTLPEWNFLGAYIPSYLVESPSFPSVRLKQDIELHDPTITYESPKLGGTIKPVPLSPIDKVILTDNVIKVGNIHIGPNGLLD